MSKRTELDDSWNSSLKTTPTRPPGDGEEQVNFSKCEGSEQELYENAMFKSERSGISFDRCDGKDGSPLSSTTPPYAKWSQGLHYLLADELGINLFQQYLEQEGYGKDSLDFWLACEGIYKKWPNIEKGIFKLLHNTYVMSLREIHPQTKLEISGRVSPRNSPDCHIFDNARKEIEEAFRKTTYPNFLQSDVYIEYIQAVDAENSLKESCEASQMDKHSDGNLKAGSSTKSNFTLVKNESQDELLPTLYEDKEFEMNNANAKKPLTREFLQKRFTAYARKALPENEAGHYLKATTPGYDTACHLKYAAYLPSSAQDSELQSLSSDALTDYSKSDTDYSPDVRNKVHMKKSDRYIRSSKHDPLLMNKDGFPNFPISKPPRLEEKRGTLPKEEFTKELTEKLRELERQQKMNENFEPQAILDAHESRTIQSWAGSSRQTPGTLTPPPVAQPLSDASNRQRISSQSSNQSYSSCYNQHAKPHQNLHYIRHHDNVPHQREPDVYSCDSGTVRDCASDITAAVSNHDAYEYLTEYQHLDPLSSAEAKRRFKEQAKRSAKSNSKMSAWESRSSFDSGVGLTSFPSSCKETTQQKVSSWFTKYRQPDTCESERESSVHHKASPPSLSPIRTQSFNKKSTMGNPSTSSNAFPSSGRTQWNLPSQQASSLIESTLVCHHSYTIAVPTSKSPLSHDQHLPMLPSSSADAPLDESHRRLEGSQYYKPKSRSMSAGRERNMYDSSKSKQLFVKGFESQDDGTMHNRKAGHKSYPNTMQSSFMQAAVEPPRPEIKTAVAYCFGNGTVPYLSKLSGRNITLKQFKSLISKKGNFKYFFKKTSKEFGIVLEEVTEDNEVLPLYEGKIFSVIEAVEESR